MNPAPEHFDELPAQMREARRWLVWRSVANPDPAKKPRKIPFYVSGVARNGALDTATDQAQLATFDEACSVLSRYSGLGFALGPDSTGQHWQGIDLDSLSQRPALQVLADDGLPGYTETSPSGNGVHAIGYGRPFPALGSNASGIEAYSEGRYFTVTADNAGLGEPTDLADYVQCVLLPRHGQHAPPSEAAVAEFVPPATITELRSALAAMRSDDRDLWIANGQRLKRLGETGRALWMEWSQQSDKFDPADAARVWDSFAADRTGYQAVFADAQRKGWVNPLSLSAQAAPPVAPRTDLADTLSQAAIAFTDAEFDAAATPHPHAFMSPDQRRGLFPEGEVTILGAPGREGKTTIVTCVAKHYALGWPLAGMAPTEIRAVMIYSAEDDRAQYARKFQAQRARLAPDDAKRLQANVIVPDLHGEALSAWREVVRLEARHPVPGPILEPLIATIRALQQRPCPLGMVIFETASTLSDAEEDNVGLRVLVAALKRIGKATGVAVVLTHHTSQESATRLPTLDLSESAFRGGTALVNNARQTLLAVNLGSAFDPFPDADARTVLRDLVARGERERITLVACLSSSKSAEPAPLFFRWEDVDPYGPRAVEIDIKGEVAGKSWRGVHKMLAGAKAEASADRKLSQAQANIDLVVRAACALAEAGQQPTARQVSMKCGRSFTWAKPFLESAVELGELTRSTEPVARSKGLQDVYRPPLDAAKPWEPSSDSAAPPWAGQK